MQFLYYKKCIYAADVGLLLCQLDFIYDMACYMINFKRNTIALQKKKKQVSAFN